MKSTAKKRQTIIAIDLCSNILKDIEQSLQQAPSAFWPGPPLEWNLSTPLHIAEGTCLTEPNGNISLSLTVQHRRS